MKRIILALTLVATQALAERIAIGPASGLLTHVSPNKAVVIMHGTAGPDSRGTSWAQELNRAGVTTLVVDFKSGLYNNQHDRGNVRFTPLGEQAAQILKAKGYTDIRWLGFSLGGVVGLHLMANSNTYTRAVVLYPGCRTFTEGQWSYVQPRPNTTLIVWGSSDDAGEEQSCPTLGNKSNNPTLSVPNGLHAFDRNESSFSYYDPMLKTHMRLQYNRQAHEQSKPKIVQWLVN